MAKKQSFRIHQKTRGKFYTVYKIAKHFVSRCDTVIVFVSGHPN